MTRAGRLSGLRHGDRVRVTREISNFTKPGVVVPVGTEATLGEFQREQDGEGCWAIWLDAPIGKYHRLFGCSHLDLVKIP